MADPYRKLQKQIASLGPGTEFLESLYNDMISSGELDPNITYEEFVAKILLKRDEQTGIINFAVEWNNPVTASEITNDLIIELNNYLRDKEIENISSNIEYLEKELSQTSIVNAQAVVFKVIEEQTKAIS